MALEQHRDFEREREEDDRRFTASLAGLAVALFLILIGLYVIEQKASVRNGKIEEFRVTMEVTFILEG